MPVLLYPDALWFPPVENADKEGLLAVGGDLSPERLLLAYRSGIFPWYNDGEPILWWSPDPRMVLLPEELKVSKSMQTLINRQAFEFRYNTGFTSIIQNCRMALRSGQDGTWITDEMIAAYTLLHEMGYAICAASYRNGVLVGGLYGIRIGNVFFGESMFSRESNASKFAFIHLVRNMIDEGLVMIDCQVYTRHLESLGARLIPRADFTGILNREIQE